MKRFEDLAKNMELAATNQLGGRGITYLKCGVRFYYITFVMDALTKRILGRRVSSRLFTKLPTLVALRKAVKTCEKVNLKGLVFHSDWGGQYFDKAFLEFTASDEMVNSICKQAWENPYAERINGVIKNNYLKHNGIRTFAQLIKSVDYAIELYNYEKLHKRLGRLTPVEFEKSIFAS